MLFTMSFWVTIVVGLAAVVVLAAGVDLGQKMSSIDLDKFLSIAKAEVAEASEENIKTAWEKYGKSDYPIKLALNALQSEKKEKSKATTVRNVVLFGSRDHLYKESDDEGNKKDTFAEPFQYHVTRFDTDTKTLGKYSLDKATDVTDMNIKWGVKSEVGTNTSTSTSKKNGKSYTNEYLNHVKSTDPNYNVEENVFKPFYVTPDTVTKTIVESHVPVILYGEIDKIALEKVYNPDNEQFIPMSPYMLQLKNGSRYTPVFQT
jgi:hypothetical protein